MEKDDVSFFGGNEIKFNLRVSAIIEKDGRILLHRKKTDDFWNLLGGRVKYGELCENAIIREISEEIGCRCQVVNLVRACENLYVFKNSKIHELLIIYRIDLLDEIDNSKKEEDIEIKWFTKCELDTVAIKPDFTKEILFEQIDGFKWLINDEISSIPGKNQ